MASYVDAFAPAWQWDDFVGWPPDVFAVANLVLDQTEGYRFVVAPPTGRHWPPFDSWEAHVRGAARAWRRSLGEPPPLVQDCWDTVARCRDVPLAEVRGGTAWDLNAALLTLHALADEACADVASPKRHPSGVRFEADAQRLLEAQGSLSRLSPVRVRILPKTNFSARGITIRSLSRYLGLCYEAVDVRWRSVGPGPSNDRRDYNVVLLPWPLSVRSRDFRPVPTTLIENMDRDVFGFFEFAPEGSLDCELVDSLLAAAGCVDALILPESAVDAESIASLESTLGAHGAGFLIAGVRERPAASTLGRNYLHFGVRTNGSWNRYEQDKHHRWCLDEGQLRQYHLTRSLHPKKMWWEAIGLRERRLHIIDLGSRITTAPMVCEDLASLDEVADNVRRIGPSLVVAVLLDGPQLASRWPCRYSSVLTDDPGSAVLTLTSFGMAARSLPPGKARSRVVAHWNDRSDSPREIELARGAAGVLLHMRVEDSTVWTADGRCHGDVPRLKLAGVRQLRP
ncbi:MAG TPA: hypothetical protein VLA87_12420 [Gaiellaceae bacterium]|nr:hypothetical protein [Gaiellaceae bacterium]